MAEIRYFDFDSSRLSEEELQVLENLKKVGEIIHRIWLKQINPETGEILLYPSDATAEEILEAAKVQPDLLSPTTVVKRNDDGFTAVPYKEEYSEDLQEMRSYLQKAADITSDEDLRQYIQTTIGFCSEGDYESALVTFIQNSDTKIEYMMGPIETYEDNFLGRKKTFQYNLRVLKEDATHEILEMAQLMKQVRLPQPTSSVGASLSGGMVRVRIDDVVMFAGRQSRLLVSSTNLPNEPELVEQFGTKVVVYTTSMEEKFELRHVPLLSSFKGLDLDSKHEEMKIAMARLIALHELAEGTVKFKGMSGRLSSCYDYVRELNADIVGLDSSKYQVLNGLITVEEYQYLLVAFLAFAFDTCTEFERTGTLKDYADGFAISFNLMEKSGALQLKDGEVEIDFNKMARDVEFIADLTLKIMEKGDEADALRLKKQYGDYSVFSRIPKA